MNAVNRAATKANEPSVLALTQPTSGAGNHRVDQQQHGGSGENGAQNVMPAFGFGLVPRDEEVAGDEGDDRDRDGEQEGPAPADARHQATEDQAEGEAAGAEHGVDGERLVTGLTLRERGGDDRQAGRGGERGGQALDEPRRDQQRTGVDDATDQRRQREHRQRDEEDVASTEQVRGATAEQEQAAVAEDVGTDQPLQGRGGQVEFGADGGKCDADHGDVEAVEEQHDAERNESAPQTEGANSGRHLTRDEPPRSMLWKSCRQHLHACALNATAINAVASNMASR